MGIGKFGILPLEIALVEQGVGHGPQGAVPGQLHVGSGHLTQGLLPQGGLELLPALEQGVGLGLLQTQAVAKG
ncbi:MAG: hypothetical protein ACK55I_12615, partial [bacterium]